MKLHIFLLIILAALTLHSCTVVKQFHHTKNVHDSTTSAVVHTLVTNTTKVDTTIVLPADTLHWTFPETPITPAVYGQSHVIAIAPHTDSLSTPTTKVFVTHYPNGQIGITTIEKPKDVSVKIDRKQTIATNSKEASKVHDTAAVTNKTITKTYSGFKIGIAIGIILLILALLYWAAKKLRFI